MANTKSSGRSSAVVLAAIFLLSLGADGHTVEETSSSCDSSTVEVRVISSNQKPKCKNEMERCGSSNDTTLEDLVDTIKTMASNQELIRDDIKNVIRDLVPGSGQSNETSWLEEVVQEIKDEIRDAIRDQIEEVKRLLTSKPSKEELVSALECKHLHVLPHSQVIF